MSAEIKYSTMSADKVDSVARKIFKKAVDAIKKCGKDTCQCKFDLMTVGHGYRPFGDSMKGDYIDYSVSFGGETFDGFGSKDIRVLSERLVSLFKEQSGKRGWSGLHLETNGVPLYPSSYMFSYDDIEFPSRVVMIRNTCKEFNQLTKLVAKTFGKEIHANELYSVNLFGKRRDYDESGNRTYTCYCPNKCQRYIDAIRSAKKKKGSISFKVEMVDDIDTSYSSYYETECYGTREYVLSIKVG